MASLRSKDNPVFGFPSPFPPNRLPTNGDVLKLLLLYHEQLGESTTEKYKAEDSCNSVTLDLIEIWEKATIPTMTYSSICRKVRTAYDSAKYCERKKLTYENKDQLFDICACQCPSVPCSKFGCAKEICQEVHILHKNFPRKCTIRIDEKELPFLMDQRGERKMTIGGVDVKGTEDIKNQEENKARSETRMNGQCDSKKDFFPVLEKHLGTDEEV